MFASINLGYINQIYNFQLSINVILATYRQHKVIHVWLGANLQCISQHNTESALQPTMPARHRRKKEDSSRHTKKEDSSRQESVESFSNAPPTSGIHGNIIAHILKEAQNLSTLSAKPHYPPGVQEFVNYLA